MGYGLFNGARDIVQEIVCYSLSVATGISVKFDGIDYIQSPKERALNPVQVFWILERFES